MTDRIDVELCTDPDCPGLIPGTQHGHCIPTEVGPGLVTLRVTGGKADVTVPFEELQRIFDIAVGSMDFGSGFLDTEEIETLRRLAVRLGVDPAKATSSTFKGQYPHQFMSYTVPDGSRVLCSYCMGTDPDKGHMPTDQYAAYCRSLL